MEATFVPFVSDSNTTDPSSSRAKPRGKFTNGRMLAMLDKYISLRAWSSERGERTDTWQQIAEFTNKADPTLTHVMKHDACRNRVSALLNDSKSTFCEWRSSCNSGGVNPVWDAVQKKAHEAWKEKVVYEAHKETRLKEDGLHRERRAETSKTMKEMALLGAPTAGGREKRQHPIEDEPRSAKVLKILEGSTSSKKEAEERRDRLECEMIRLLAENTRNVNNISNCQERIANCLERIVNEMEKK
ncbi:hypothetical protein MAM1_0106c05427 [Mucor ambiguus]|uniref:Uncharacterized protein n=1 Tax=Mucor ambiguus TaxID=91626 RepID=A0A0C9M799_9FUNG|nr:hypothetical protein MAM1_0106c05427 [Mucor ambiguus]